MLTNAITRNLTISDCDGNREFNCNGYSYCYVDAYIHSNTDSYADSYSYRYCYRDSNLYTGSELDPTAYTYAEVHPGAKNPANSAAAPVAGDDRLAEPVVRNALVSIRAAWPPYLRLHRSNGGKKLIDLVLIKTAQDFS